MDPIDFIIYAGAVLPILLLILLFYRHGKNRALLKKEKNCIRIKKKLIVNWCMIALGCCSVIFCGFRLHDSRVTMRQIQDGYYDDILEQDEEKITADRDRRMKNEVRRQKIHYLILGIWGMDIIIYLYDMIRWRYGYVSANGVYYSAEFLPADKTSYAISGNKLQFYRKHSLASPEFTIIENYKQLETMLSGNYQPKN